MKKTVIALLLILGAIVMMAKSASAGPQRGNPTIIIPQPPPQPFTSAT